MSDLQHLKHTSFRQGVLGCRGTDRDIVRSVYHGNWMELPPIQVHNYKCGHSTLPTVEHPVSCRHRLWFQQSTEVTSPWFYQQTVRIITKHIKIFRKVKKKIASAVVLITGFSVHAETSVQDIFTRSEIGKELHGQFNSLSILISVISLIFTDSTSNCPTVRSIHFRFTADRFLYPSMIDNYFRN